MVVQQSPHTATLQGAHERAAAPLVSVPPATRRLSIRSTPSHSADGHRGTQPWWLLAVQGGAGVSSLIRAGADGQDADRSWPTGGFVVAVTRRTSYGLEWARDVARQHASSGVPDGVVLAGLVVVADAPGRAPRRLARFLDLVCGAYPRVWEVPWVEEWRLAGHAEPLPTPPAVRQLRDDMRALTGAGTDREKE